MNAKNQKNDMSNQLAKTGGDLKSLINSESVRNQIARALPSHMTSDRFLRVATTMLLRVPKLGQCSQESFMKAMLDCMTENEFTRIANRAVRGKKVKPKRRKADDLIDDVIITRVVLWPSSYTVYCQSLTSRMGFVAQWLNYYTEHLYAATGISNMN
jgi:hypothetical protein